MFISRHRPVVYACLPPRAARSSRSTRCSARPINVPREAANRRRPNHDCDRRGWQHVGHLEDAKVVVDDDKLANEVYCDVIAFGFSSPVGGARRSTAGRSSAGAWPPRRFSGSRLIGPSLDQSITLIFDRGL